MTEQRTVARTIASACRAHSARRVFGVPGGGSCLDLIRAFAEEGIAFVLARTETAAVLMAAATAELTGGFGVAMTTQGPGTASATNGVAHASLDRAPVLLLTDGWTARQSSFDTHQVFDQRALMAPITKASTRLEGQDVADELERLIALMTTAPWGPVHVELTGENARRLVATGADAHVSPVSANRTDLDAARRLIASARWPVVLLGLEARTAGVGPLVEALVARLGCPVLPTYKAKGIVSDTLPNVLGLFTGGAVERATVDQADLIVLVGLDPVELIGRPWPYKAPVLDLAEVAHPVHYVKPVVGVYGPLRDTLEALGAGDGASTWQRSELETLRTDARKRLAYPGSGDGLTPEQVVAEARAIAPPAARVTVDAGAHMFSAMAFWDAPMPGGALISNGLASMGFALPAAIAVALEKPEDPVIAFTGDGGLMMCLGELATAAQQKARVVVVVFNDASLSLIALKQQARQLPKEGIDGPRIDFAAIARGCGLTARSAATVEDYRAALRSALACEGPVLIDVRVDPSGYLAQSVALRG
ncbi:MAG: thiamine pyrophosphate-binding protein [Rhodospirillales bacterium]|nr:thiamine pyrophosphate-binding protein [Rhodospirillales bacterium]